MHNIKKDNIASLHRCIIMVAILFLLGLASCKNVHKDGEVSNTTNVDSLLDETTSRRLNYGLDATIKYIDTLRVKLQDTSVISRYTFYWLYYDSYFRMGHQKEAIEYLDSMLGLLESTANVDRYYNRYVEANYYKADILLSQKRYNESYQYYYMALQLAEKHNDTCQGSYYYYRIGLAMYSSGQYAAARRYFSNAVTRTQTCTDDFSYFYRQQQLLNNIGLCYAKMKKYDSAILYYNYALKHIEGGYHWLSPVKHNLLKMARGVALGNLGEAYVRTDSGKNAEGIYKESIAINSVYGADNIDAQYTRVKLAELYMLTGRSRQGIELLEEVSYINDSLPDKNVMLRWNKLLWQYYDGQKNNAKAYHYLVEYNKLNEELSSFREMHSMAEIDDRVNNLKDRFKIVDLTEKDDANQLYLVIAVLAFLLAMIVTLMVVQNLRRSRRHVSVLQNLNEHINIQRAKLTTALNDLEEADNEKDRILKAVSHDMRSPINSSLALIDLLSGSADNLSDEQREFLGMIKKSNENALNLTRDLLEVATLNSEQLEKTTVNLSVAIAERIQLLKYKAAEKSQTLEFATDSSAVIAEVNEEKILRVLNNLVTNAIKFSPVSGLINVSLSVNADTAVLKVKDNGIGIPAHMQASVFDIFSEAKRFGTKGEQPFGLGLSICKQIVEAHQGKIWLESEEGRGTTFFVSIPL